MKTTNEIKTLIDNTIASGINMETIISCLTDRVENNSVYYGFENAGEIRKEIPLFLLSEALMECYTIGEDNSDFCDYVRTKFVKL